MRILHSLIVVMSASVVSAADWPQFKGPGGTGVSAETNLPVSFTAEEGVLWKSPLPARGLSSPVVVGDKVFVTCSGGYRDDRLHVLAFNINTGEQLWHRQLKATGSTICHPKTCMAANTPVADANAVYCLFATADLAAFDHDGNLLWYRSLNGDYKTINNQVGMASSPVLAKDKLIVPMDNSGDSFLAAIDTQTGKNVWKMSRPRESNWVTPLLREITSDTTEVIFQGPKDLTAYDLNTGKEKWSEKAPGSAPTPTVAEGYLVAPSGGVTVYKISDDKLEELWKSPKYRTGYASPLYYDGFLYATNSTGIVSCADIKTGDTKWQERLRGKQTFSASPVAGDGKVYVLSESGTLAVFKSGAEAELLGTSELAEECLATPAIANGALFIRTDKQLWCIGAKK